MFKISFFVPISHVELVKEAMFAVGAGQEGSYSHCAWQVLGEGQFLPLSGSRPFIGKLHEVNKVPEYYVEMLCVSSAIECAIKALKNSHPYEQPAYCVVRLEEF